MEQIKLLVGFDNPEFEKDIVSYLKKIGYEAQITVKLTKNSIREYIQTNPDTDALVLLKTLNNLRDERLSSYNADELASLTDECDINVVIILDEDKKGTDFMRVLYGAGILSAVFQDGKGKVTVKEICNLIAHKRTRAAAREYYGLREAPVVLDFLADDTFATYYNYLLDDNTETTMYMRFYRLCQWMTDGQIADFIRRLPYENIEELGQDPEFYEFCEKLKKTGISVNVSRPKAKKGKRNAKRERVEQAEMKAQKVEAENQKKVSTYKNSINIVLMLIGGLAIGLIFAGICLNFIL